MDIFRRHEQFEIEVLERLKNHKFLLPLLFGGGTMLRLCHDLPRYSADLDFWFLKKFNYDSYFAELEKFLRAYYDLTDTRLKYNTLLYEIRSSDYPRRLKLEIRKYDTDQDHQEKIAFSRFTTRQVILKVHTLDQTMKNKTAALLDRKEIRDAFDIEFLLRRGIVLPELSEKDKDLLIRIISGFREKDFKVTLGSTLERDLRAYYVKNGFDYLKQVINVQ